MADPTEGTGSTLASEMLAGVRLLARSGHARGLHQRLSATHRRPRTASDLRSIAQRIDEQGKGRRGLASAWVVEMVP
jgi:hypothetical protein